MTSRRWIAAAAITVMLPTVTTGCFGRFDLTRKVYKFNQDVSPDKWGRWIAFLVLTIIPIYGLSTLLDAVLFNSVEFWTGDRLVTDAGKPHVVFGPQGEVVTSTIAADGSLDLEIAHADGRVDRMRLVRERDSVSAYDADGDLIARVGDVFGNPGLIHAR